MIARTNHTIACFRPNMRCHIVLILLIVFAPLCGCLTDSSEFSPTTDLEDYLDPETCEIPRNNLAPISEWGSTSYNQWITVNDLMHVSYNDSIDPETMDFGSYEETGRTSVDEQWKCGYRYHVWIPSEYTGDEAIPLVIHLHGGLSYVPGTTPEEMDRLIPQLDEQPFVIIMPEKKEWEWLPSKVEDIVKDAKQNLLIDEDRVHLTGLSMGGRGTMIVAAELPNTFASIALICPHHWPTDYRELAPDLAHIPTWMSHGDIDDISRYDWAVNMSEQMEALGADVQMITMEGHGHCNWDLYTEENVGWMMDQRR